MFGGVTAVDDVSLEVLPGEIHAVIGPNGAGKTSIFNCLNAVYRPASGDIVFGGESMLGAKPVEVQELLGHEEGPPVVALLLAVAPRPLGEGRGRVGPRIQCTAATGALRSRLKSLLPTPTLNCNGRSRLVHNARTASWSSLAE